ncbi:MAG TPA: class I SAM-dependent methyltransferase [Thermoanaerobaculia bacterium]|nr:class I SAM-dependent methyltransferase [Thermoanaerobaculia bacterium]
MLRRPDENWELLAQTEPYYAVLTDDAFLGAEGSPEAVREFFATGEREVAWLLGLATQVAGREFGPRSALDFGCGVGRLAIPMASRVARVVGVDVSPTMIELAKHHRDAAGIGNAEFVTLAHARQSPEQFDFIYSLIVFQHIPPVLGYELMDWLVGKVAAGGVAALHVVVSRPGGLLRRIGRQIRSRVPLVHRAMQRLRGDTSRLPYMEMNVYALAKVLDLYRRHRFGDPRLEPTDHGGIRGVVVIAQRS